MNRFKSVDESLMRFNIPYLFIFSCMLFVGGCVSLQSTEPSKISIALPQTFELTDVPFFPQTAYQCGPAALATMLKWSGQEITPDALVPQTYLPKRQGSLQIELLGATRRYGRVPYVLPPRIDALLTEVAAGHPVIVLQNLGLSWYPKWHYAVVVGFDLVHQEIVLRSGVERRHISKLKTFEYTWRRADYWALVVLPPEHLPQTADETSYLQAVITLERLGRWQDTATAYATALTRWPDSVTAQLGLGNSRYALHDLVGAEQAFRDATRMHPASAPAFNNLAQTLFDQERLHEASEAARRAIEIGGLHLDHYRKTLAEIESRIQK